MRERPTPLDIRLMNVTASFMFGGGCILVLVLVVGWALRHPVFSINRIVVEGELVHNNAVTLRANVAPHLAGNFFTIDLPQAQTVFEQVPWVRKAEVRRAYPNSLRVLLHEHVAQAYWGAASGAAMVNTLGEVFEANLGELEREGLPRLDGPEGSAPQVLAMFYALEPLFQALDLSVDALSLRELEVCRWAAEGKQVSDIAQILGITPRTVTFHLNNVVSKLGASSKCQAISWALKQGVVRLNVELASVANVDEQQ